MDQTPIKDTDSARRRRAGRIPAWQTRALLPAAVLLLAGAGLAFWPRGGSSPVRSEVAQAPKPGARPDSAPAADAAPPARLASAATTSTATAPEFDAQALRQLDRQWCSHGAQAALQFAQSLAEQFGDTPEGRAQAKAQLKQLPSERATEQLQQQLPQQWIASLLQRGDARSRATALFLAASGAANAAAAVTELSALAHGSADPYVAALAQQRAQDCRALAGCQPLSPAERLAKDPNNLVAFFDAYGDAPDVLRRLSTAQPQPHELQSYRTELLQTLLSLPLSSDEGLYREVEQSMLIGLYAAWRIPNYSISACRKLSVEASAERAACQMLAETLWTGGDSLLERALAVGLAKAMRLQTQQSEWLKRQEQLDTVKQHQSQVVFERLLSNESDLGYCDFQRRMSSHLRALSRQGEWQMYATQAAAEAPPARP